MSDSDLAESVRALINEPDRKKPEFIKSPDMDKMVSVVLRLAMEISVLRDRIDTGEKLAAAKGIYDNDDIENYQPDAETKKIRDNRRDRLIENVMRDLM